METQATMIFPILFAAFLGGLIGWEREHSGRAAGIRTFTAIAIGACAFGLISIHGVIDSLGQIHFDPTRIASNVVVGVGFLGAGMIFHPDTSRITGLTTAATLWATASVGLALAFNMYIIAILVTIIMLLMLWLPKMSWWKLISAKRLNKEE